jgi:hypothetical protein
MVFKMLQSPFEMKVALFVSFISLSSDYWWISAWAQKMGMVRPYYSP